jgi:hypothetical protein
MTVIKMNRRDDREAESFGAGKKGQKKMISGWPRTMGTGYWGRMERRREGL